MGVRREIHEGGVGLFLMNSRVGVSLSCGLVAIISQQDRWGIKWWTHI